MSKDTLTWGGEPNLDNRKSDVVKLASVASGTLVIDIRLSQLEPVDLLGNPKTLELTREQIIGSKMDREINQGDMVLMEVARGWVETVVVDEVHDGIVYGLGDDGEPYCAPLSNCDKVPL